MKIYYEGTEISGEVLTRKCIVRDTCGDRCDSLELEFENAEGWYRWGPQEDDRISVSEDGYDSGTMFLNTVLPENGKFRILATALPCRARRKAYQSFRGRTIEEIMRACAMESAMEAQIFGIDGKTAIPYFERDNESCAALLLRLLRLEGAALKCVNGKYTAIGLLWAQERAAAQTIRLMADQEGAEHRRSGVKLKALTLRTPYAEATATDTAVPGSHVQQIVSEHPARDNMQAGRWARSLLIDRNRQCESLKLSTDYNVSFTAMERIDISGAEDTAGEWMIAEAEHDFINKTSQVQLLRCIKTIR